MVQKGVTLLCKLLRARARPARTCALAHTGERRLLGRYDLKEEHKLLLSGGSGLEGPAWTVA